MTADDASPTFEALRGGELPAEARCRYCGALSRPVRYFFEEYEEEPDGAVRLIRTFVCGPCARANAIEVLAADEHFERWLRGDGLKLA